MMDSLLKRIEKNRKAHTRWLAMVLCLSMLVSLGTFAGLHKSAQAKVYTKEVLDCPYAYEGAEPVAHVHNDDCYDGETLVCTLPELEAHTHTEECFAEQRRLTCGLEENPGHQHGEGCYVAREVNVCGLEENPGHEHNGTCYNESGVLICGMETGEGAHVHSDDCFTTVYDLVCQIPEGEGAHTHTDDCYTTERILICEKPELQVHVHDAGCFRTEEITVDEPEETTEPEQTAEPEQPENPENPVPEMPVSDPAADLESASDWERDFDDLELSGNWAQDLVLVAATQQGRGESPNNFEAILNDAGDAWVLNGYTRYGAWYGAPYAEEWSAMFVSFCLRYAGIPTENVPNNPTAALMAESFSKGELFVGRGYVPAVGDLIFFDTVHDDVTSIDHMGIVYHVDAENGTINTVEGDRTNAVATFGYHLDDEEIIGYGILPQNPDYIPAEEENNDDETDGLIVMTEEKQETEETTDTEATLVPAVPMPAQSWERTAGGIKVTVEAPEGAFPENTKIAVTPVNGNSLKDTVSDAVNGEVLEVQAVDITFFDVSGHEIEPAVPIRVVMTPAATQHAEEKANVVHVDIAQQTAELIEQAEGTETDNSEVVFDADAFTIYAIVYTYQVEFEYEVDGKVFTSSMPGAENMTLAQIVEGLGIVEETEIDTFVSKISSIASTNEKVAVVNENNEVRVLKDGDAQIVITMQDGAKFHIDVRAEGETSASNETATVSTKGDLYLPADAELKAEVLDEVKSENAIAAVEAQEGTADSNTASAESAYQVFDISLENVSADQYDGFQVEVKLPENVVGRDFRLFHIHDGETTEINLNTVSRPADDTGLEVVSGFTFETQNFSEFVLKYTVDFEYEGIAWSWPGQGSYALTDVMAELGIYAPVKNANLVKTIDHGAPENALYLESREDGWYLNSETAFTDTYLLMVTAGEKVYEIKIKDAQYTTDLNSLMTDITAKVNGKTLQDGDSITVVKGDSFDLHLEFEENDFLQFVDDNTEMVYHLPEGINLGDSSFSKNITIDLGIDGQVYKNKLVYDPADNTLKFKWNTKDPRFGRLAATDNAKIVIDVTGFFDEDASHIKFSEDLEVDVKIENPRDADIQKSGQFFEPGAAGNPFNEPAIKYTVTVTSTGETTVNVNDVVEGSAVKLVTTPGENGGWTATSNRGTSITPTFTEKGFTLNGQTLLDGEVVTITYWGKVDTSNIQNLTDVQYSQTGNKVKLTGDGIPEKEKTHYEHVIGQNRMNKSAETVGEVDENGKQTVTWKIVANSNPIQSIGGSTIKDSISYNSLSYMSYSGDGIKVVAKRANGEVQSTNTYDWNTENLTQTTTDHEKSWTFTVPETDEALYYEIEYTTVVDTTKFKGLTSAVNTVEGKPGQSSGSAAVGVPEGDTKQPVNYTKKAVSVNEDETVWNISVNIDKNDQGFYDRFEVLETLPQRAFNSKGYVDDLVSITVNEADLLPGEHFDVSEIFGHKDQNGNPNDNSYAATGEYTKPTAVKLTFYRSEGTSEPGINAANNRTLNIQVVTKNNPNWLAAVKDDPTSDAVKHINTVKINDWADATDTVVPMAKVVIKGRNGGQNNRNVAGPSETNSVYKAVGFDENGTLTVTDDTKVSYPIYEFWAIVGGVTKDNLNDGKLIIEDTFDDHFYVVWEEECGSHGPAFWGSTSPTTNGRGQTGPIDETFEWSQSNGKATFTITNPRKNGDSYYPYYYVQYYLAPKDAAALDYMRQAALENDGKAIFSNIVSSDGIQDELDFSYDYNVIDKSSVQDTSGPVTLEKYTIKINPDMLTLNGGKTMTMTDTYSKNLAVDFGSIVVTAVGKDGRDRTSEVTWDYRSNVGTFTIPDETYVVITYSARVVGDRGSLQVINNTAYMEGYFDTVSGERYVEMSGSGSAERVRVRLFKFAADHMEGGLDGAIFRLLDQDMHPVKDANGNEVTFTTGIGYMDKYGVVNAGSDGIMYSSSSDETDDNYYLYDSYGNLISRNDLTESGRVKWDAGEIRNPAADIDHFITYGDLNASGMAKLGITYYHGFAEIALNQSTMGIALKKERAYYLEEISTPVGPNGEQYEKDFVKYSFLITDQSDYSAPAGIYVYHNNDVVTVRNWPTEKTTLKIAKTFTGNATLSDEQKNKVTFTLQKKVDGSWVDFPVAVWDERTNEAVQTATFTYGAYGVITTGTGDAAVTSKGSALFQNGVFTIEDIDAGEYRVVESNATMMDTSGNTYSRATEYLVDGQKQTVTDESQGVSVTITDEDVTQKKGHDIAITNSYFTNKYEITKVSSNTAQVLGNAKFKIVKVDDSGTETDVVNNLATGEDGKLSIQLNNNEWDSSFTFVLDTLYYVVETEAPAGYITPASPDKYYFYFSSEPAQGESRWAPSKKSDDNPNGILPKDESATDLSVGYGSATISNAPDITKTYVKIDKKWVNSMGKDITSTMTDAEAVDVTLYRTTEKLASGTVISEEDEENPKNAADVKTLTIKWGSNQETKINFIAGDKLQLTMTANGADATIKPDANTYSDITFDKKNLVGGEDYVAAVIKSWLLTTKSAENNPTITINENSSTPYSLTVTNLDQAARVYKLTQAEAAEITNGSVVQDNIHLSKSNDWTQTVSNLDVTDANGTPYFYYVIETGAHAQSSTNYEIASKTITVTNTAPDQLEVNKKWEDPDGNAVNSTKTEGSITYELYQVENPLAVGPYTGTGSFSVNIDNLNNSTDWDKVKPRLIGNTTNIAEGSKVRIVLEANDASNQDLSGDITVTGGQLTEDANELFDVDKGNWTAQYHRRTITIENVTGNISLSGVMKTNTLLDMKVTVLEEPTNAATEWDELVKNKIGEVVVSYNNATLTKESAFSSSSIRVTPGTKAWSSLVYNLPASGTNSSNQKVNYTYYVVEKNSTIPGYEAATYQVNGEAGAVGDPGDTVVIINKEVKTPKGSVKVTKAFSGVTALPAGFKITATYSVDDTPYTVELTTSTTGMIGTGTATEPYTWEISDLPLDTVVKFTETGYDVNGYSVTVNGSATASQITAIAASTPGEASFVNTYTPKAHVEAEKVFTNGTIAENQFSFTISAESDAPLPETKTVYAGTDGKVVFGDMSYPASLFDDVTAGDDGKKTITYTYTVAEVLPEGVNAENPIKDGIRYDTEPKTVEITAVYDPATGAITVNPATATVSTSFTNEQLGALKLTKKVTVNGTTPNDDNEALTNGTYEFTVAGVADTATKDYSQTVSITFQDGKATSYKIGDEVTEIQEGEQTEDFTWGVVLKDLTPGDYIITEIGPENGTTLTGITGGVAQNPSSEGDAPQTPAEGEQDGSDDSEQNPNNVTVHVTAGDTAAAQESAQATFTNNIDIGKLQIKKVVTYNGSTPPEDKKALYEGDYTFTVCKNEHGDPYPDAEHPMTFTVHIGKNAEPAESGIKELPAGDYWIKENVAEDAQILPVGDNPQKVTVTPSNEGSATQVTIHTVTNDLHVNEEDDELTLDVEKRFIGINGSSDIPGDFQIVVTYNLNGTEHSIVLKCEESHVTTDGLKVNITHSENGLSWKWHVYGINENSTNVQIKEVNYTKSGYDLKVTYNGSPIEDANAEQDVLLTAKAATLTQVTGRTTSQTNMEHYILDNEYAVLVAITGNVHGTAVISKRSLNMAERDAITKGIPSIPNGPFDNSHMWFYSEEEHFVEGQEVTVSPVKNRDLVFKTVSGEHIIVCPSSSNKQAIAYAITYDGQPSITNAMYVNEYTDSGINVDVIKVKQNDHETKLAGAEFTLLKLTVDEGQYPVPTNNGTFAGTPVTQDPVPTDNNGVAQFTALTQGYYELTETKAPEGYVLINNDPVYFQIENGQVKWIEWSTTDQEWIVKSASSDGMVTFENAKAAVVDNPNTDENESAAAKNATFTVENTPGTQLPQTGGIGTTLFTALGGLMTAMAGAILTIKSYRRRKENA